MDCLLEIWGEERAEIGHKSRSQQLTSIAQIEFCCICVCVRACAFVCCVCVWLFETAPHQPIFQLSSNMDKDGNIGIEPSTETVYGTHDDNTMVMSEKVIFKCTIPNEHWKTIFILQNAQNAQSYWPVSYQLVVQSVIFFFRSESNKCTPSVTLSIFYFGLCIIDG